MKRVRLTGVEKPRQFGEEPIKTRLLIPADLIELVKEEGDHCTVFIGHGIGPMIVNESYDEIDKMVYESTTPQQAVGLATAHKGVA